MLGPDPVERRQLVRQVRGSREGVVGRQAGGVGAQGLAAHDPSLPRATGTCADGGQFRENNRHLFCSTIPRRTAKPRRNSAGASASPPRISVTRASTKNTAVKKPRM